MRALLGPRPKLQFRVAVILALVAEGLAGPGFEDDIELFEHALLRILARHAEPVIVEIDEAAADAEFDPPARHQIDHGQLFGYLERVVQRQHHHSGADSNLLGPCSYLSQEGPDAGNQAVAGEAVLTYPHLVHA